MRKEIMQNKIYDVLLSRILNNEYEAGQQLIISAVAAEFNINPLHVREALNKLVEQMLIIHEPMRGFFVKGLSLDDFKEIAKIRQCLELPIVERFIQTCSDETLSQAINLTRKKILFLENDMKEDAVTETKKFFALVYSASNYHRMVKYLTELSEYISKMIYESFDRPEDVEKTIINSKLLIEVLEKRDVGLAKQWIDKRYNNLINKLSLFFQV